MRTPLLRPILLPTLLPRLRPGASAGAAPSPRPQFIGTVHSGGQVSITGGEQATGSFAVEAGYLYVVMLAGYKFATTPFHFEIAGQTHPGSWDWHRQQTYLNNGSTEGVCITAFTAIAPQSGSGTITFKSVGSDPGWWEWSVAKWSAQQAEARAFHLAAPADNASITLTDLRSNAAVVGGVYTGYPAPSGTIGPGAGWTENYDSGDSRGVGLQTQYNDSGPASPCNWIDAAGGTILTTAIALELHHQAPPLVLPDVLDRTFNSISVFAATDWNVLSNAVAGLYDIDPATLEVVTGPSHGSASIVGGQVRYTPTQDVDKWRQATDSLTYRVADIEGNWSLPATVTINRTAWRCPKIIGSPVILYGTSTSDPATMDINFTSTTGNVIVLHMGRTNSATTLAGNLAYAWDPAGTNAAMTQLKLGQPAVPAAGDFFLTGAVIRGGATGAKAVRMTRSTSIGRSCLIVFEVDSLPSSWLGSNPNAVGGNVATLNAPITPAQAGSLLLAWGGLVSSTDAQYPILLTGGFTKMADLNSDTVPDASVHTRAVTGYQYANSTALRTPNFASSNGGASASFRALSVELKGEAI